MTATISQRVDDVRDEFKQGKVGEFVFADENNEDRHVINSDPQAVQVDILTVTGATNAKLYEIIIEGVTIGFLSGGAATTSTIAAGLKAAIDANPTVSGLVTATVAAAIVTVTSNLPGIPFTMTEADGELTTATTQAAATALPIGFGLAVCLSGFSSDGEPLGKLARNASFSAQVDTAVYAGLVAGEIATIAVEHAGITLQAQAPFNTNNDTTVGDLRTAATAAFGGLPITVSGATDTLILTADLAGDCFKSMAGARGSLTSTRSRATCAADCFLGLAVYSFDVESTTIGQETPNAYPANEGAVVGSKGRMWVENSQGVTLGDPVFVELDAGSADVGKLFNTSSATRVRFPKLEWYRAGISGDGIADVRVSL